MIFNSKNYLMHLEQFSVERGKVIGFSISLRYTINRKEKDGDWYIYL